MEMRYDKEIDDLFARFQKGVALIKGDPSLFRGKLYMSVKDVNPNDQKGVLDEFVTKVQKLVGANKESNFLLDLYSGQLDINCSPPLGTIGYYQSLMHAQNFVENSLGGDKDMGFRSGKAFLNCIRLVLAKITILDWTSLDEGTKQFQLSEICSQLPGVIRTGCIVPQEYVTKEGVIASYLKEDILSGSNGKVLDVDVQTMCTEYPAMAEKWGVLNAHVNFDKLSDWTIDFGFDCCSTSDETVAHVHNAMKMLLQRFLDMNESVRVHMCGNGHECQGMCDEKGICRVDVFLKQSSKTFTGARGSFQFTFQEMNGSRKKCSMLLPPGQQTHQGAHTCIHVSDGDQVGEIIHYCEVRCPCCSYFCKKKHGHFGSHTTSHGNMRNTYFLSDAEEIDVEERKYKTGERGIAEMCNVYCSKMGREHVHYVNCDQRSTAKCVYSGSTTDQRRHCIRALDPKPEKEVDEILHEQFWKTLGWEDPCTSKLELELFGKCGYKCDAPIHDDKPSYCILPAWHTPEPKPSSGFDGFTYVSGHKFECSHVASGGKIHHVFVLDCSGSMRGHPWNDLLAAVREYIYNRIADGGSLDLVSIVTFDSSSKIVYEAQNITTLTKAGIPYRGGGTTFAAGLRAASEVLSRVNFDVYKPAVVFFSDGQPCDPLPGEQLALHIKACYQKYGLLAFAVGFGRINLSILERVAQKMGGAYHQVLTGNELKTTFFSISASLSSRAGLALANPVHERNCVICGQDLASEETVNLKPCDHELHTACLEVLVRNAEQDGECARCPSCRCKISS
ncbi:hypothetical protein G195_004526 [Phytophthora kernoviae 00238/432]|uniref:RING-type domain-containing protein n=1 Tax=Phytophthora kernoviae 00238/432 TaxID=1284355 RepID=A0A8J4S7H3_9STRA|nr:hypothetical protein G195_004526 [Phytophthora kernoviae 00238/432]